MNDEQYGSYFLNQKPKTLLMNSQKKDTTHPMAVAIPQHPWHLLRATAANEAARLQQDTSNRHEEITLK